jgi:hypothetical protein
LSEDALGHIEELPRTITCVDLPGIGFEVNFVLLSGDRLYTAAYKTLFVYSASEFTSPIATYVIPVKCWSGLIVNNCLFLGGGSSKIIVYEISTSLSKPLKLLASIETRYFIIKVIKVGQELVLGEEYGYL